MFGLNNPLSYLQNAMKGEGGQQPAPLNGGMLSGFNSGTLPQQSGSGILSGATAQSGANVLSQGTPEMPSVPTMDPKSLMAGGPGQLLERKAQGSAPQPGGGGYDSQGAVEAQFKAQQDQFAAMRDSQHGASALLAQHRSAQGGGGFSNTYRPLRSY